ncbi:formyltransferase family protein [Gillisia sp. JM1]|uniref:formyltransferase family protein n=1 Tax=Gillisia sp. JM1 TaxID=1283286 RepID=UPI0003FDDA4C|nr:formyltransferase family protein [Gillisia sp. JM1]
MKVLLAIGNHPRHKFLIRLLKENGFLDALIIEKRENFIPFAPENLDDLTKEYFVTHFEKRNQAEVEVFDSKINKVDIENRLEILPGEINHQKTIDFVAKNQPDILITFGIGILQHNFLSIAPKEIWNIHGGLSPWYKGTITHFWPSYHLQPQFTGCTIHYINSKIDGGAIIHQTPAILEYNDGLHQLSCKSLKIALETIVPLLNLISKSKSIKAVDQKTTGKLWLKKDWKPQHLKLIYGLYEDKVVNAYLDGELVQSKPQLIQQKI